MNKFNGDYFSNGTKANRTGAKKTIKKTKRIFDASIGAYRDIVIEEEIYDKYTHDRNIKENIAKGITEAPTVKEQKHKDLKTEVDPNEIIDGKPVKDMDSFELIRLAFQKNSHTPKEENK